MLQQVTLTVQKVRKTFIQLRKERKIEKLIDYSFFFPEKKEAINYKPVLQ